MFFQFLLKSLSEYFGQQLSSKYGIRVAVGKPGKKKKLAKLKKKKLQKPTQRRPEQRLKRREEPSPTKPPEQRPRKRPEPSTKTASTTRRRATTPPGRRAARSTSEEPTKLIEALKPDTIQRANAAIASFAEEETPKPDEFDEEKTPKPKTAEDEADEMYAEETEEEEEGEEEPEGATAGEVPQIPFVLALFLSVAMALMPWLFPQIDDFSDAIDDFSDTLMVFVGALAACLSGMGAMKKIFLSRRLGYAILFFVLGVGAASFLLPARLWAQNWKPLDTLASDSWTEQTEQQTCALHEEGVFDLFQAHSIRLSFDPRLAGAEFRLFLVPEGADCEQLSNHSGELIRIPDNGVATVPLKAAEFGLTREDMREVTPVVFLSGTKAKHGKPKAPAPTSSLPNNSGGHGSPDMPFGNNESDESDMQLVFPKIEVLSGGTNRPPRAKRPRPKPPDNHTLSPENPPPRHQGWQLIASSSQTWTDEKAFSAYAEGSFNLSHAEFIRVSFEPSQAGIRVLLRLVPLGADPNQLSGIRFKPVTIPDNGVVTLPLEPSEFGLRSEDMQKLVQIAVLSGDNAWNYSLKQDASKRADFKKIELWPAAPP